MSQSGKIDIEKMNSMMWYHKIELGAGIVTPGLDFDLIWKHITSFIGGIDFKNKTVLDIGCWDGKWTFEAERRGAKMVVATDDVSQRPRVFRAPSLSQQSDLAAMERSHLGGSEDQFRFAHAALGSHALYYPHVGVYNVDHLSEGPFDIVLFLGVLYHLHYPFLAIAKIRQIVKEGGIVIAETACLDDGTRSYLDLQLGDQQTIYPDPTTWCAPSTLALRGMFESSYFEVEQTSELYFQPKPSNTKIDRALRRLKGRALDIRRGRMILEARAVVRETPKHVVPDPFLAQYDPRFRM